MIAKKFKVTGNILHATDNELVLCGEEATGLVFGGQSTICNIIDILRITDAHTPAICANHPLNSCKGACYDEARPKKRAANLEVTFHRSEMIEILNWVFENYFKVKTVSPLLDDEFINNAEKNKPPTYLWTKLAKKEYEGRR